MSEEMYKGLLERQYELNLQLTRGIEHIGNVAVSLKELQEKQTLKLDNLIVLSTNHTVAISNMEKIIGKLMMLMVLALIVLAGAKEIIPILGK